MKDFTMLYETVEMVYACMDFAGGMCNGILKWIVHADESVLDITTRLYLPIISRSLIFSLISIPPHEPFYLETPVLQPSNVQKHLHQKTCTAAIRSRQLNTHLSP